VMNMCSRLHSTIRRLLVHCFFFEENETGDREEPKNEEKGCEV
jgi:hypothetical protein